MLAVTWRLTKQAGLINEIEASIELEPGDGDSLAIKGWRYLENICLPRSEA